MQKKKNVLYCKKVLLFLIFIQVTPNYWDLIPKAIALLGPINAATKVAESDIASVSDILLLTKKMKFEISQVSQAGIFNSGIWKVGIQEHILSMWSKIP